MPFKSVGHTLREFKEGELHSGKGGPVVSSRKQAIAIALSKQRRAHGESGSFEGIKRATSK